MAGGCCKIHTDRYVASVLRSFAPRMTCGGEQVDVIEVGGYRHATVSVLVRGSRRDKRAVLQGPRGLRSVRMTDDERRERVAWAVETAHRLRNRCMGCRGAWQHGLQVHEIERRSHAPTRWAQPCNYLLLCPVCHGTDFATMCHARQLAHKLYWDAGHFDLQTWLRIRDPELMAPNRILPAEVEVWMSGLRDRFG